jgi:glycosyltransferase involved in cell wall biosynthesis
MISIAMATYNGERYLQEQLDSLLQQTRLPDELIVTDDCSSDSTLEIAEAFARRAPFTVKVSRNDANLGYCGNFNQAISKTGGDIVLLSDQDDVWLPGKIERLTQALTESDGMLVAINDAMLTDGELNETGLTKLGQLRGAGYSDEWFVMGCCAAIRRPLLDFCMPIDPRFHSHDQWLVRMAGGIHRKLIVPEVLQLYRRHGENTSTFLVNRTVRVNRWQRLAQRCASVWKGSRAPQSPSRSDRPKRHDIYMLGVKAAADRAGEPYRSEIAAYYERLVNQQRTMAKREEFRKQGAIGRAASVYRHWRSGGYAEFSGAKSALRDLFLR